MKAVNLSRFFFLLAVGCGLWAGNSHAAGGEITAPKQSWEFEGAMAWDKDALYRGYTVATQVCMSCHSFKYINHRQLMNVGFTEDEVRAMSAELDIKMGDKLISALDDATAKEIYGKTVPDLSLMNKARAGQADYVYAVLTGYDEDIEEQYHNLPEGVPEGAYYNTYFPGHAIAMPNPLTGPDMVEYHDGTEATVEQMAKDVTYFMQYTAEPERMNRSRTGIFVLLYLVIFTVLAYLTKRMVWRDVH